MSKTATRPGGFPAVEPRATSLWKGRFVEQALAESITPGLTSDRDRIPAVTFPVVGPVWANFSSAGVAKLSLRPTSHKHVPASSSALVKVFVLWLGQ